MSWIKSERIDFINEYERRYGVRLSENDEMLPIIHFIFDAGKSTDSRLSETKSLLSKLERTVTQSSRENYYFSDGDALKWQIGIGIKILIIIAGILMVSWSAYFYWSADNDVNYARQIIASNPVIENNLLQNVRLDSRGYYFLEFNRPKEDVINFLTEYELRNDGSVRVYLLKK